jgi:hypothetical protein
MLAPPIIGALVGLCVFACLAVPAHAAAVQPNSADKRIMWTNCAELATLTDTELDLWKSRGVDGFVCMGRQLWGMGGADNFTTDLKASLSRSEYALERSLRDSDIVARAKARDMKMYLGTKLVNYYNDATPLRDWFDDAGWSDAVLPAVSNLAAAARQLGFAGLAFDQELYAQFGGAMTATWDWNYPGNTHTENEVRAQARKRGSELMRTIVDEFPDVELVAYDVRIPETWGELVQKEVNGYENAYGPRLDIDFWEGISSVEGYAALRLFDHTFYKTPHLGSWDSALHYHYNRLYSYLSRHLSNWSYASTRLHVSPFSWIGPGPRESAFDDPRPVSYVAEQLEAFKKWGMGGEFADYSYRGLRSFDYSPYASAMSAASTPSVVDSEAPDLVVRTGKSARKRYRSTGLAGTTADNLAVRVVRWSSDRGHAGVAKMTWEIQAGTPRSGYTGQTRWSIPDLPLEPGENKITITTEDIKGLTTSSTVTLHGASKATDRDGKTRTRALKRARRRCAIRARPRHDRAARRVVPRRCALIQLRSL